MPITYQPFPATEPTLNGVAYIELEGLEEGSDERGGWARKSYLVDWSRRMDFMRGLRGTSALQGAAGTAWIRAIPYQYPDDPTMYAQSVMVRPEGALQLTVPISYPYAIFTVTFRPPTWDPQPAIDDPYFLNQFDPTTPIAYATQEVDFGADWTQLGRGSLVDDTGAPIASDLPVAKRITVHRMVMTWHELPYLPLTQLRNLADTVNDATFLGCGRGTLMLESPRTSRERSSDGKIVQRVTVSLKWRKHEWNEVMDHYGKWKFAYYLLPGSNPPVPDTSTSIYDYANFTPLLYIGQSP